jgi:hypothetical protein
LEHRSQEKARETLHKNLQNNLADGENFDEPCKKELTEHPNGTILYSDETLRNI